MAPRNTRNGATATARRASAKGGSRASSASRSRAASIPKKAQRRVSASRPAKTATHGKRGAAGRSAKAAPQPWRWWAVPAVAALVLVVFAWTYYPVARVQYRETREKARLETELTSLRERNDRLREQVDRLKTPQGVEDYARSELGLVKRGESVAVVLDGDGASEASAALAVPQIDSGIVAEGPVGPWTAFLDLVFGEQ